MSWVELTNFVEFTVMPLPKLAVAPDVNPLPSTLTLSVVPCAPVFGDVEVTAGLASTVRQPVQPPVAPAGFATVVGERGVTLSGGQRQRVALARALVRRPRVLILDDATSAVDPLVEAEILAGLRGGALDTTTLIVAHRVSTIELADRVLFLEHGRVVATGPHRELLATEPAYARIVQAYEAGRAA